MVSLSTVINCLSKAGRVWESTQVRKSADGAFYVVTGTTGHRYVVEIGDSKPECYCPGYQHHGCCYHSIIVLMHEGRLPFPAVSEAKVVA